MSVTAMKVQVRARNKALEYAVDADERLLYGGLRNAIDLPYECATGTCGTCRARLIEGEIEDLWPESPGKKNLKPENNEFLLCQCAAKSDLSIEIGAFVERGRPGAAIPIHFRGRVANCRELTRDVLSFEVELDEPHAFEPGQFVAIRFPGVQGYRGYSMVNYDPRPSRLEFVIKRFPGGGVSGFLFDQRQGEGSEVELFGPLGSATFHPSLGKNILCIAGGSGIAGMVSILIRACQDDYFTTHDGHLFFGVRTAADVFFADRLAALQAQYPDRLRVVIGLSDDPDGGAALSRQYPGLAFDTGFIHEIAGRHMQGHYQDLVAYLAGPPVSVDASIRLLLLQARLPASAIRYDKFS